MRGITPLTLSLIFHAAILLVAANTSFDLFNKKEKPKKTYTMDLVTPKKVIKKKVLPTPKSKKAYKKTRKLLTQKQKSPVKVAQGNSKAKKKALAPIPPFKGTIPGVAIRQQGGNHPPQYPVVDRIRKNTGTVTVLGYVNKLGKVSNVQVDSSTGTTRMNSNAIAAFKNYRFQKGREGWVKMPFEYTLDQGEARVLSVRDRHTL